MLRPEIVAVTAVVPVAAPEVVKTIDVLATVIAGADAASNATLAFPAVIAGVPVKYPVGMVRVRVPPIATVVGTVNTTTGLTLVPPNVLPGATEVKVVCDVMAAASTPVVGVVSVLVARVKPPTVSARAEPNVRPVTVTVTAEVPVATTPTLNVKEVAVIEPCRVNVMVLTELPPPVPPAAIAGVPVKYPLGKLKVINPSAATVVVGVNTNTKLGDVPVTKVAAAADPKPACPACAPATIARVRTANVSNFDIATLSQCEAVA